MVGRAAVWYSTVKQGKDIIFIFNPVRHYRWQGPSGPGGVKSCPARKGESRQGYHIQCGAYRSQATLSRVWRNKARIIFIFIR